MTSGFSNQPKKLRGALVEFGVSVPPLVVIFQFNPETITRTRTATPPTTATPRTQGLANMDLVRQLQERSVFSDMRGGQTLDVRPQTFSFDIRFDATDGLNDGEELASQFGVGPQLATLEQMMLPKNQSLLGTVASSLVSPSATSFAFFDEARNPPITLFVWGRKKVLPVNITSMTIREQEYSIDLHVTRATASVTLEVIEGPNAPFLYSKAMGEAMSLLSLADLGRAASTLIPT